MKSIPSLLVLLFATLAIIYAHIPPCESANGIEQDGDRETRAFGDKMRAAAAARAAKQAERQRAAAAAKAKQQAAAAARAANKKPFNLGAAKAGVGKAKDITNGIFNAIKGGFGTGSKGFGDIGKAQGITGGIFEAIQGGLGR